MSRRRRYRSASAWLIAWLAVAHAWSGGPMTAGASESAPGHRPKHRTPQSASSGPLPTPGGDWRPRTEPLPWPSSSEVPAASTIQQGREDLENLAVLLAKHISEQPPGRVDFEWIDDARPFNGVEELPAEDEHRRNPQENRERQNQDREPGTRLDPELVRQGQNFFQQSCTMCHEAERATSLRKTLAGWRATVRRMARQEGADIPAAQHTAIATYLASLNPAYQIADDEEDELEPQEIEERVAEELAAAEAALPPFTLNGTLSPVWRGTDSELENKGFFPDVWLSVQWHRPDNPVSAKVTSCTSCHGVNNGLGVELVEASAIVDLFHLLTSKPPEERPHSRTTAELKMGRFIVPFGAFAGRVHPGALRTVSPPLMYNMGRRVGPISPLQPVIPQPYSDEGVNLHLGYDLPGDWSATLDTYAVNGLQFGGPAVFFFSRSYRDNNSNVAVGGRATIGNRRLRFGGSITGGELQDEGAPRQTYTLAGGDVSYRHGDLLRAYYEYAIRQEDSFPFPDSKSIAYGNLVEAEVLLLEKPKISFLARYDTLEHRGALGTMSTERFTYGLNWLLPGGSLLIVDHEHWNFDDRPSANILGLRWTAAF